MKSIFTRLGLGVIVIVTAILAWALLTVLIGVCTGSAMPCRIGMLPAILVVCVLLRLAGIGDVLYFRGHKKAQVIFQL